jgi:hypothetical protein
MHRPRPTLFLLVFLAVLQVAQGFFSGAALCREETGEVTLEWSRDGQCATPGFLEIECLEDASHASESCGPCFDVPLPSETSLKSVAQIPQVFPLEALSGFYRALVEPPTALSALASLSRSLGIEPLSSVRLLI